VDSKCFLAETIGDPECERDLDILLELWLILLLLDLFFDFFLDFFLDLFLDFFLDFFLDLFLELLSGLLERRRTGDEECFDDERDRFRRGVGDRDDVFPTDPPLSGDDIRFWGGVGNRESALIIGSLLTVGDKRFGEERDRFSGGEGDRDNDFPPDPPLSRDEERFVGGVVNREKVFIGSLLTVGDKRFGGDRVLFNGGEGDREYGFKTGR